MARTHNGSSPGRSKRRTVIDGVDGDRVPRRFTPEYARRFSRGRWGIARTVVAAVLAVVGALSVVTGVTLQWLQHSVVDRDGFAEISRQLAEDQSLREELTATAVDNASRTVQDQDLGGLPFGNSILDIVDRRVTAGIEDYADSDRYVEDWNRVVLTTHELNIQPAGTDSGSGAPKDLEIYTAPVVDSVEGYIEDRIGFGIDLDLRSDAALGGADGIIAVGGSDTGQIFDTVADSAGKAQGFVWGGVAALILAVLLARHREWVLLSAGVATVAGVLYARGAAAGVADGVTSSPNLADVGRSVVQRIFDILLSGLDDALSPLLWGGVIAGVLGLLLVAARLLWRWGDDDGWAAAHVPDDDERDRRIVEL